MDSKTKTYKAYAKVNLALDVLRKRDDGYHDVRMIMQNLDIYDELEFTITPDASLNITITADKPGIPTDEHNLIYKAIAMMAETYGISGSIFVKLTKNIPVEAGMAGGSTDCATTIKAMNDLYELKLSTADMMAIGVRLGADVPYCILARTALSEGIGEVLTPVEPLADCTVLVVKPPVAVSTGMIYGNIRCEELTSHPDIDKMLEGLAEHDIHKVASTMENVMETVTSKLYPIIDDIKSAMISNGALNAIMSGSGSAVFGIYKEPDKAWLAAEHISECELATDIFITKPISG